MKRSFDDFTDERLVELYLRSRRHDEALFVELFRRRRSDVWGVCRSYFGSDRVAEDLTQEVFFAFFRKLRQYQGRASVRTWLHRIATNMCKNEIRRRSRRTEASEVEFDPADDLLVSAETPENHLLAKRQGMRLRSARARLKPDERFLLQLVEHDELPYAEVAEILNVSPGAVKMRVLRARVALQTAFRSTNEGDS